MKVNELLQQLFIVLFLLDHVLAGGDDPCGEYLNQTKILLKLKKYEEVYKSLNATALANIKGALSGTDVIFSHQITNSAKLLSQATAIFQQVDIEVQLENLSSAVLEFVGNFFNFPTVKDKKLGKLDLAIKQGKILIQEADDAIMSSIAKSFGLKKAELLEYLENPSFNNFSQLDCILEYLKYLRSLRVSLEIVFKVYGEKVRADIIANV
jgi:hypothetical protein